jgi:hypothetical protein
MDFILDLPRTSTREDAIWVVVDIKCSFHPPEDPMETLARLYVQNVVQVHGVPSAIVLDRDSRFTLRFWQSLHKKMGMELKFSTAFQSKLMAYRSEPIRS